MLTVSWCQYENRNKIPWKNGVLKWLNGIPKMHTCNICNRTFSFPSGLIRHMQTHTGEKPYICSQCRKRFARPDYLAKHERTHTGEKPYKCTVCGMGFKQKAHVNSHMTVHTGEKPYKCTVCGMGFGRPYTLTKHARKLHTNPAPSADSVQTHGEPVGMVATTTHTVSCSATTVTNVSSPHGSATIVTTPSRGGETITVIQGSTNEVLIDFKTVDLSGNEYDYDETDKFDDIEG